MFNQLPLLALQVEDFMMDTTVNGDPMLMSAPVSPEEDFAQFNN